MKHQSQSDNFLDYIPRQNVRCPQRVNTSGQVEVQLVHRSVTDRLAQLFFKRKCPRASWIELEGMGSFIWRQIDGRRSIYALGQLLLAEYGSEAEPLYERLCTYIGTLCRAGFLEIEKKTDAID